MAEIRSKILEFFSHGMIDDGSDDLKFALGSSWQLKSAPSEYSPSKLKFDYEHPNVSTASETALEDAIRALSLHRYVVQSDWQPFDVESAIASWEYNPYNVSPISPESYMPNFKIPMRFYSSVAKTKGDLYWNIYWTGGMWGDKQFYPLIDETKSFYAIHGTFSLPYYIAPIRLNDFNPSSAYEQTFKTFSVKCNYPYYDEFIQNRLEYEKEISERLLPNFNYTRDILMRTYDAIDMSSATFEGAASKAFSTIEDYTMDTAGAYYTTYMPSITTWTQPLNDWYFQGYIGHVLVYTTGEQNAYLGGIWPQLWNEPNPSKSRETAERRQENIMFDQHYYAFTGGDYLLGDPYSHYEDYNKANLLASSKMYSIEVAFHPHKTTDEEGYKLMAGAQPDFEGNKYGATEDHGANPIRDIIERYYFSSRFLELLKDIDEGSMPDLPTGKMDFKGILDYGTTTHTEIDDTGAETPVSHTASKIHDKSYKFFDWTELLAHVYNEPLVATNDNYMFIGPSDPRQLTTMSDSTMFTYVENQSLLSVLDYTMDYLGNLYKPMFEALKQNEFYNHSGLIFDSPSDVSNKLNQAFIKANGWSSTQALAYKVEKFEATPDGKATGDPIQKFWFFNSSDMPDEIKLTDSQVKFGKLYVYRCTAYAAVLANQYKYTNLRLTKLIGQYDGDPKDFYCVQFYNPSSNEAADQTFAARLATTADGDTTYQTTGLSDYNTVATLAQDLITEPQAADLMLNIQPCVKIVEFPMFEKTCGVYDNPCSGLTVEPFQFLDDSQKIGFSITGDPYKPYYYPALLNPSEEIDKKNYMDSIEIYPSEFVSEYSRSPARYLEMYRIPKKPTSFYDFGKNLVSRIDLKIPEAESFRKNYIATDKIKTNKTYYYLFRFVSDHGMPSWPSSIIEARLVNDGGYIYSLFEHYDTSQFILDPFENPSITFKKMLQIEPNVQQLQFDVGNADFSQPANTQLSKVKLGTLDDKLWEKKFKIRLTSKRTGKKIDLNIDYKVNNLDRTSKRDLYLRTDEDGEPAYSETVSGARLLDWTDSSE